MSNKPYKITGSVKDDRGDYMTKKEFISSVEYTCLIDYDGVGYYCIGDQVTNIVVYPSNLEIKNLKYVKGFDDRFDGVVWYNK